MSDRNREVKPYPARESNLSVSIAENSFMRKITPSPQSQVLSDEVARNCEQTLESE